MTLTFDRPRATLSFLRRLAVGLAASKAHRDERRRRQRTRKVIERESDWQLEDIGVRRGNNPQEPQMRRGWW